MKAFNTLVRADLAAGKAAGWLDIDLSTVVPVGKRLVIEYVSTSAEMPPGQKPNPVLVVVDKNGSAVVQHYPVSNYQLQYAGSDIYKSADSVKMILARNLTLRVDMTRDQTAGEARCYFGISGYVTD